MTEQNWREEKEMAKRKEEKEIYDEVKNHVLVCYVQRDH